MKDLVIIPTFDRPEFLWLCLDYIRRCSEVQTLDIRVYVDYHESKIPPLGEIAEVLNQFRDLSIHSSIRGPHRYLGNSYNVMMAYLDAYKSQASYVFMVEDDLVVTSQFFAWHYEVQNREFPVVSIGVNKTGFKGYASLGVCFKRENLKEIVHHCTPRYFRDMKGYLLDEFPSSSYEFEQDGLICRIVEGRKIVWAENPVAQHVGWYGYHRPHSFRPSGSVKERYEEIQLILNDPKVLKQCVKEFFDVNPLNDDLKNKRI